MSQTELGVGMNFFIVLLVFAQFCLSTANSSSENDTKSIADRVLGAMNASVDPCDDFYQYACGSWINSTEIPADRTSYTSSFSTIDDRVRLIVRGILENETETGDSESDDSKGSIAKAKTFFQSCIGQHASGPLTTSFLDPFRESFRRTRNAKTFSKLMAHLQSVSSSILFSTYIGADDKNPTQYTIFLGQASLFLPHRDNYLKNTERDIEIRKRYRLYIEELLMAGNKAKLLIRTDYKSFAKQIVNFERHLAKNSLPRDQLRDPEVTYNKRQIDDMPHSLHLPEFFKEVGIDTRKTNGTIVIDNPAFYEYLSKYMSKLDTNIHKRSVVRGYLAFRLASLANSNGLLGEHAYSKYYELVKFIFGVEEEPEKWKTCQGLTTGMLGDAIGRGFVKDHFKDAQLNAATSLVNQIRNEFNETLTELDWMDRSTKQSARVKLSTLDWKIGYSSNLRTYEEFNVTSDLSGNVREGLMYWTRDSIERLGKPVDKTEWFMYPQTVNAYYSPTGNEMAFPAGILQPTFFSDKYPDAMNYGAIGMVIGHELLHGFDDSGRKYDETGELRSWWSNSSAMTYENRSQCYVDLYSKYKPADVNLTVNGAQTLGENIADVNGLKMAFRALKSRSHKAKKMSPRNIYLEKNFTNEQLFFISFAQQWCQVYRPESLEVQLRSGVHSPAQFRVEGPLSMSPDFAEAFQCKAGSRYNPPKKCTLW